jgi:hypothetical protein
LEFSLDSIAKTGFAFIFMWWFCKLVYSHLGASTIAIPEIPTEFTITVIHEITFPEDDGYEEDEASKEVE